jgi:hypothetical protein
VRIQKCCVAFLGWGGEDLIVGRQLPLAVYEILKGVSPWGYVLHACVRVTCKFVGVRVCVCAHIFFCPFVCMCVCCLGVENFCFPYYGGFPDVGLFAAGKRM